MSAAVEPAPPQLPVSYSRTASNGSALESMQIANQAALGPFEGRPPSFPAPTAAPAQMMYSPAQSMVSGYRSFSEANNHPHTNMGHAPQIYTAVYSGVQVYEMEINGVAVMRRRSDSWMNATQILKVAGVDKGKRTKVLEKEILVGEHEKVQGGYGKYQGTWINYRRSREFCRQYGVEDILRPLLDYDVSADGSGGPGQGIDTPTKEQAMAANRKRFYTATLDGRGNAQASNGTFFQNISSTASNALAAMNKVARMNSPAPRPGSAIQRRPGSIPGRTSQAPVMGSQESFRGGSQQSMPSLVSERSFGANGQNDSAYGTQIGQHSGEQIHGDMQEPPRKRMRPSSQEESFYQTNGAVDVSMREGTPTEPNESFVYHQASHSALGEDDVPTALPPLPQPGDKAAEDKQGLLLDLFADPSRSDYSTHPAIQHLSGSDLDLPLDQSANTALHWAATLARVSLMRLLISKGASIFRGNIAGQTPLMSAVAVNNCLDHNCFPELLEVLGPLIEVRDAQGRTILHHIAVSCGIKGRAASSKYYLEALLEFLVRNSSTTGASASFDGGASMARPIGLMRFLNEMVNARDRAGNTALNLVARIGNRSIIQQLLEVQADPTIPNYKGLRPIDFGVGSEAERSSQPQQPLSQLSSPNKSKAPASKVEETSREIMPSLTSTLTQTDSQFTAELRLAQDRIDRTNAAIRDLSAQQKASLEQLESLQRRARARSERAHRIQNLRRAVEDQRKRIARLPGIGKDGGVGGMGVGVGVGDVGGVKVGDADQGFEVPQGVGEALTSSSTADALGTSDPASLPVSPQTLQSLPSPKTLQARLAAYTTNNASLRALSAALKARNSELERMYRKVVSLCTGVEEGRVEEMLGSLVAAVESEREEGRELEVGRVREFLRKVEGVGWEKGGGW